MWGCAQQTLIKTEQPMAMRWVIPVVSGLLEVILPEILNSPILLKRMQASHCPLAPFLEVIQYYILFIY